MLSKNAEDKVEQPSASAYVLCLYKSHWLHILDLKLRTWGWQGVLSLTLEGDASFSWFSGWLLQCKLLDYILVSMPRIAIWNVTAK